MKCQGCGHSHIPMVGLGYRDPDDSVCRVNLWLCVVCLGERTRLLLDKVLPQTSYYRAAVDCPTGARG